MTVSQFHVLCQVEALGSFWAPEYPMVGSRKSGEMQTENNQGGMPFVGSLRRELLGRKLQ